MKIRSLTVAAHPLAAALIGCKPPPENTNVTAILGAVLIDGNGGPPVTDSAVVIAAGRIRAAGSRGNVPIPAGSNKINGAGLFLMPGLVDLHVHLGTRSGPGFRATEYTREQVEKNLNAYLYLGVTSVRSAGTEREAGFAVRTAERGGELLSARLFTAGRGFTAPGGHPSQEIGEIARQPRDVDDARKQVGELAAQNVDLIKIWVDDLHGRAPKIDRAVSEAIIDEARKFNIPVVAHIFSLADTDHLFKSGATGFLHMIRDTEEISPGLVNRLRALRIVFTPTLVRQELAWLYSEHPGRLDDPDVARTLPPDVVAAVREAARASQPSPVARDEFERAKRNSRRLASSGVQIAVGSDGGSSIDFPGLMTHREIELLVESGFSPVDAITAATRNGALGLGKLDELGTIEPGKRADLLLLSANPLEDVRNLRKIARLMLNGEWIDRERLKMK
ncbi:MAG: amidohydrolase family protein [Bryobacteraceae bacterium]